MSYRKWSWDLYSQWHHIIVRKCQKHDKEPKNKTILYTKYNGFDSRCSYERWRNLTKQRFDFLWSIWKKNIKQAFRLWNSLLVAGNLVIVPLYIISIPKSRASQNYVWLYHMLYTSYIATYILHHFLFDFQEIGTETSAKIWFKWCNLAKIKETC